MNLVTARWRLERGRRVGRSARKRAAILDAARDLFLQRGYGGTSMDDVAARAAVSKQTVYKNFADKQRLFIEVITSDVGPVEDSTRAQMAAMPDSADVRRRPAGVCPVASRRRDAAVAAAAAPDADR